VSAPAAKPRSPARPDDRYRRLPTGAHGIDPEEVKRDQRERLRSAIIELIAERGYQAVRILDLTKLARVSRPTFYSLYTDKEELLLAAYDEIAQRTAKTAIEAYQVEGTQSERLTAAIRAFAELAADTPQAMSLMVLGAFGAGGKAIERRNETLEALEQSIHAIRSPLSAEEAPIDLTLKMIIGGVREVTAARLRQGRAHELPGLADELATWAACYPVKLPAGLACPPTAGKRGSGAQGRSVSAGKSGRAATPGTAGTPSARAVRAEGRLPSGRHDLTRQFIVQNQRERIIDATASIVAEKGLASLTIPEIAKRANVSHQTFYEMYPTKDDAFLGAQKIGMHQALLVTAQAYDAHKEDWPRGVAAGLHALLAYLASEPALSHLILVDTFAASPEATEIRDTSLHAFAAYLQPGYDHAPKKPAVPGVAPEAIAGGVWQILNHYIEAERTSELPDVAPQLIYAALAPFLGPSDAAKVARRAPPRG
jgi:AcrR family transcriptional regulator